MKICWFLQSNCIFDDDSNTLKKLSPHPIAAGNPISAHLIDMCDATPPYFVIRPAGFFVNIQSKPGSAFSINKILFFIVPVIIFFLNASRCPVIFLFVIINLEYCLCQGMHETYF